MLTATAVGGRVERGALLHHGARGLGEVDLDQGARRDPDAPRGRAVDGDVHRAHLEPEGPVVAHHAQPSAVGDIDLPAVHCRAHRPRRRAAAAFREPGAGEPHGVDEASVRRGRREPELVPVDGLLEVGGEEDPQAGAVERDVRGAAVPGDGTLARELARGVCKSFPPPPR